MSEVHCTAWIHCDPKDFDFVKQTLQDHGMLDEAGTTDSSVIFSAMYFNSDDATCVIDDLGDKVYDFEFDFEDYQFDGRWRYTMRDGFEHETRCYRSDIVHRLLKAGFTPQEASRIIELVA